MHPAIGPALVTLCVSLAMAVYIIARRHKEPLHWMLLGYLAGLALWTGGVLARFTVTTPESLGVALRVIFVGIVLASSFWLLTAMAYARGRAPRSGMHPGVVVGVVSSLFLLALFTNDGHRLFMRKIDFEAVEAGPPAYGGPLFWGYLAWAYGCVGMGMLVYLRAARAMLRSDARRRGVLLAVASAVPPATSTIFVFQLLPLHYDLTPIGLLVALALLSLAIFRYQLLESLPLARDAVLAHLDDGVVMASASGRITDWNPAAGRILGTAVLRRGSDLGAALADALDPGRTFLLEEDVVLRPCAVRTPDGRLIEVTTAVVDEGHGDLAGRFAIVSDRSATDRAEQLARQTQRLEMVGALAGEVALQINDPLTFVRSSLVEIERLGARVETARGGPDAELADELADLRTVALETLEGVERIRRIVEGMRALSSAERVGSAAVDLNEVAREALRLAQLGEPGGDGPSLGLALDTLPAVSGNPDRLVQVVLNLLVNARQALGNRPGARIHLETRAGAREVELEVRDNGPGIPETVMDRVFDPFFTTRGPDEGTGLGLAIAHDIAREHGGALEVSSRPGQGASFVLRLPVQQAELVQAGAGRLEGPGSQ
jgi:signal transduction histidine kinase